MIDLIMDDGKINIKPIRVATNLELFDFLIELVFPYEDGFYQPETKKEKETFLALVELQKRLEKTGFFEEDSDAAWRYVLYNPIEAREEMERHGIIMDDKV